jgi:hypothetical protein
MSKVIITPEKLVIDRIDTDRVGNDVIFFYATPELADDDPAHKIRINENELLQFIMDYELVDHQDLAQSFLQDAFEDVKDRYWDDVLEQRLLTGYKEAIAYIQTYVRQISCPMSKGEYANLQIHVSKVFGVEFGRRAA